MRQRVEIGVDARIGVVRPVVSPEEVGGFAQAEGLMGPRVVVAGVQQGLHTRLRGCGTAAPRRKFSMPLTGIGAHDRLAHQYGGCGASAHQHQVSWERITSEQLASIERPAVAGWPHGLLLNGFPVSSTSYDPGGPVLMPESGNLSVPGFKLQTGRGLAQTVSTLTNPGPFPNDDSDLTIGAPPRTDAKPDSGHTAYRCGYTASPNSASHIREVAAP